MAREVTCVTTDSRSDHNDCRCIETIGYEVAGDRKTKTPREMHFMLKVGDTDFYVEGGGSRAYLEPVERDGTKYVRTEANDTEDDNLLEQPSC